MNIKELNGITGKILFTVYKKYYNNDYIVSKNVVANAKIKVLDYFTIIDKGNYNIHCCDFLTANIKNFAFDSENSFDFGKGFKTSHYSFDVRFCGDDFVVRFTIIN